MPSSKVNKIIYQEKGRNVVETLKNSSIYFQQLSSLSPPTASSSQSSSTSSFIFSRQEKSIEISSNNFYRIFKKLLSENGIEFHVITKKDNNNKKKHKNHRKKGTEKKNDDEIEYYWIVDAADNLLEKSSRQQERQRRGTINVPSNCLENLDRTIRDKVQLMIQQNKQDDLNSLYSIGVLNECFEILKSIDKMNGDDDANNITDDDEEDCIYDLDNDTHFPSDDVPSSRSPKSEDDTSTSKENEKDPLVQRGAEVVQELLFSSPYFTPKSMQQQQQQQPQQPHGSPPRSSTTTTTSPKPSPDKQYDSYKLSDQKFKSTIQKYVPSYMYQRGNPSSIYNCVVYLKENPNLMNELLLTEETFLEDLKRTRNDRVFIAIQKFYILTKEGDCFYKGNDSHLRYIGILDYAHQSLSGIKSPKHSVWNIV